MSKKTKIFYGVSLRKVAAKNGKVNLLFRRNLWRRHWLCFFQTTKKSLIGRAAFVVWYLLFGVIFSEVLIVPVGVWSRISQQMPPNEVAFSLAGGCGSARRANKTEQKVTQKKSCFFSCWRLLFPALSF